MTELDETDRTILAMLQENGRTTYAEIGQAVGLAASSINDRIRKLQERGAIEGIHAVLSPPALRLDLLAFIFVGWNDPATEKVLASVADAEVSDAIAAVDAAAAAGPAFARMAPRKRAELLRRCFELMTRDAETFARLISRENGKALGDARGEVADAAEFFRWFAEEAVRINGDISVAPNGGNRIVVQYQPIGVSLLITPWNFPAAMATRKIAPALAAGCTCILKPAEETPLTALALAAMFKEAGVPDGVVNVIPTSRPAETVAAM